MLAAVLVVVSLAVIAFSGLIAEGVVAVVAVVAAVVAQKRAFALRVRLPAAPRPSHPVVVWNPRSGGGKALRANLAEEARARGIEPIELGPGQDLVELVEAAVARGADALAAAGGDGTQALVAEIAAKHDLPFACIPAGTRNHFALDLGVDRDDVVGALDALVSGGERRVDLAEVNGRTFVNNVSLGLYAQAVQRTGYRDAKLRTILDTVPDMLGPAPSDAIGPLRWSAPDGRPHDTAVVILVSNNTYRLGRLIGSGTRPRIDEGLLGVAALAAGGRASLEARPVWRQWSAPTFEVGSTGAGPGRRGRRVDAARPTAAFRHPSARVARAAGTSPPRGLPVCRSAGDGSRGDPPAVEDRHREQPRRTAAARIGIIAWRPLTLGLTASILPDDVSFRGPRPSRRAVRRDRREILDAAWELARSEGLVSFAMRDLGAAVGMRAQSLYAYFPSKNAIYDAMFADGEPGAARRGSRPSTTPTRSRRCARTRGRSWSSASRTRCGTSCCSSGPSRGSSPARSRTRWPWRSWRTPARESRRAGPAARGRSTRGRR